MKLARWIQLIAVLHVVFLIAETVFWQRTLGGLAGHFAAGASGDGTPAQEMIRAMLWNQGVYNGFLAAGLFWSSARWRDNPAGGAQLAIFFLSCVVIAGLFGFLTVNYAVIFLVQAVPAGIVLAAVLLRPGQADTTVRAA